MRVGFLGAGLIGRHHAASLGTAASSDGAMASGGGRPAAAVVSVYDPDPERARAFARDFAGGDPAVVAAGVDEVVERSDAVYVCTWTSEHPALVARVVEAGRAVFCEKPLAVDLATARAMVRVVEQAGVTNQVGLVLRSVPGFALVRHLLRRDDAGRLSTVVFRDDQDLPVGNSYGSTWRGDRARAGAGTLLEHSIHDLDLLEWMCGPLAVLSAHRDNLHGLEGIEDTVSVSFRFRAGGTGVLTSTWHDVPGRGSNRRFELFTERARFETEGNAAEAVRWQYHAAELHQATAPEQTALAAAYGLVLPGNADLAFVEAVRDGRPAHPDFRVVLRAHELVDAVYRSADADGAPVFLPDPSDR